MLIFDAWLNSIRLLTFFVLADAGSGKRDRLVEWVEKALFVRLNNLFEITVIERNHHTLLSARNLLTVVREPQPYVLNIFPRHLPKVVVSGEYFILKDIPFYAEACEADAKARQEHLEQREEKRQERKLRKAPGEKGRGSSSSTRPPTGKKKKKTIAKVIKASTSAPKPLSTSTASVSSRSASSV